MRGRLDAQDTGLVEPQNANAENAAKLDFRTLSAVLALLGFLAFLV